MKLATQSERIYIANTKPINPAGKFIVYWMQASQRVAENPALNYAVELANKHKKSLVVCFGVTAYPAAQRAHYDFMLEGLAEVAQDLSKKGIAFICKQQNPVELALSFDACCIVCDENYTRTPRLWRESLAKESPVQVIIVDSNVIVPVRLMQKEEWAAYTIRPKLWKLAPAFLQETALPKYHGAIADVENKIPKLTLALADKAKRTQTGGMKHARAALAAFCKDLNRYEQHNDPSVAATSKLSSYLHFGQISPVEIVQTVSAAANSKNQQQVDAFIEQLFVRREVAHNFTFFQPRYDELNGCPEWARKTLAQHAADKREYIYSQKELETGKTHDELWNAAQLEMVRSGYMHNYLRMLWAKKILEWSETPEIAFSTAVALNDTYELDGRDPNGYTGVAWSIGGKHDRPWFDRPIYGQVRYMSSTAAQKKFDAARYLEYLESLR